MNEKLHAITDKILRMANRYPMVLTVSLIGALSAVTLIKNEDRELFNVAKLLIVSLLGISLFFGINIFSQRNGKEWLLNIAGLFFLGFIYFILPDKERDFTEVYAFLLIPLFILSHLFVSFAAYLKNKNESKFWHFNKNLLINLFLTAVFTGVLALGLVLAIMAADNLFEFNLKENIYGQTLTFTGIFGSTLIFLLFSENGLSELENRHDYPAVLKFFTQFILIPLLIIYLVILYFYTAKIILQRELPRGWVSYLILAYSVVGILANLLVYPLKNEKTKSWVQIFSKIFYYTLLPLLALLFTAIFTRILEYGYTEPRYFVLLIALWLTVVVFYNLFALHPRIKFIPQSLFVFGVFALTVPYLNAFAVAKRSQKTEFTKVLVDENLLKNGKINFNKRLEYKTYDELSSKFGFLADRKAVEAIYPYLEKESIANIENKLNNGPVETKSTFQSLFKNVSFVEAASQNFLRIKRPETALATEDYLYILPVSHNSEASWSVEGKKITYKYRELKNELDFSVSLEDESSLKIYNLEPFLQSVLRRNQHRRGNADDPLSHTFSLDNLSFKIYLNSVHVTRMPEKEHTNVEGAVILIKRK